MSEHVHEWKPVDGEVAQYACPSCGATGFRAGREIRAHKSKVSRRQQWTARDRTGGAGGRVSPRITEDWDGGRERDE